VAALAAFAISTAGLAFLYYFARQAQIAAVRDELTQLARVLAVQVDGDLHRTLESRDREGSAEHLRALMPLARFHRSTRDVIYVYTAVLRGGRIYFVLDPSRLYRHPEAESGTDPIMTEYTGHDPDLRRALTDHVAAANTDLVVEPHRTYLSAFAPFYDSHGTAAGVVGVDMWVRTLEARLAQLRLAFQAAVGVTALLSIVIGAGVLHWRQGARTAFERHARVRVMLAEARDAAERHAQEAEEANRAKSSFLAVMSHELRTPLNAIVGYGELIGEELAARGDEALGEDARRIQVAGRHLMAVISDILDYSKADAGRMELELTDADPVGVARDAVVVVGAGRDGPRGPIQVAAAPAVPLVRADATRLRQILVNLIGNAVKFGRGAPVGVTVDVIRGAVGDEVRIAVRDHGPGIPDDRRHLLFQPFSQVDASTSRQFGGTGLGLAVSQRLAGLMDGRIEVESQVGVGSTFTLVLPALAAQAPAPPVAGSPEPSL
jgi:signal transduction histidine kinase